MKIGDVQAIDVHGHYGTFGNRIFTHAEEWLSASAEEVARRARESNIQWTIVSPCEALTPRFKASAVQGNISASRDVSQTPGLLQWVVVHPLQPETYKQADAALRQKRCVGIKIHPEEHGYPIKEYGDAIFQFAAERRAVLLTHSGELNSLPQDFVPFANCYPEVTLILAHLGCSHDKDKTHQVRAIQASQKGNVFVDTSSANSIFPGLIEWAVCEVGADRVLFGSDTPTYSVAMQRARIDTADISNADKQLILRNNAVRLLKLPA